MDRDELFDEAVRFVVQSGQASTSMLQRRFRIGFSRAGRLVDMMERDGIIGPADGSKAARDPGRRRLLRDGGRLAQVTRLPGAAGRRAVLLAALLCAGPPSLEAAAPTRPARADATRSPARRGALPGGPAGRGHASRPRPRRAGGRTEWEAVVLRYRRVVARYPQSGYCDNALLAIGDLYREMADALHAPRATATTRSAPTGRW